jgi:hypothetical protein
MHVLTVDEDLLETTKTRAIGEREMAVSAEQLFDTLEDGPSWAKWTGVICEVTWTSPKPFGKGTTRTVTLGAVSNSMRCFGRGNPTVAWDSRSPPRASVG